MKIYKFKGKQIEKMNSQRKYLPKNKFQTHPWPHFDREIEMTWEMHFQGHQKSQFGSPTQYNRNVTPKIEHHKKCCSAKHRYLKTHFATHIAYVPDMDMPNAQEFLLHMETIQKKLLILLWLKYIALYGMFWKKG